MKNNRITLKNALSLIFLVSLALILCVGCGKKEEKTEEKKNEQAATSEEEQATEEEADESSDYYYVTEDGSVGLCDYTAFTYHVVSTDVTEEQMDEKMQETLDYFRNVLYLDVTEVTDDLVSQYYEYSTVEELKEAYAEVIKAKNEEDAQAAYEEEIVTQLVEGSDIFVDVTEDSAATYNSLMAHYKALAYAEGVTLEEYAENELGITFSDLEQELAQDAVDHTMRKMVVLAVAEAEGYTVTKGEYNLRIAEYMEYYGYEDEASFEYDFTVEYIMENMLMDITLEKLVAMSNGI